MKTKKPSFPLSQKLAPWRPLDWRWQRASSLFDAKRYYSPQSDDVATGRALQFIRAQYGVSTSWYKRKLLAKLGDVEEALAVFGGPLHLRLEIESRILARQSFREIARRVGLHTETVGTYESLFFNVCDRLDATTFISLQVIDPQTNESGVLDHPGLTKLIAYHAGPVALEAMLRYFAFKFGGNTATISSGDRLLFASIELFIQAQTMVIDRATAEDLLKKWRFLQPILEKVPRESSLADEFHRQTQSALDNLPAAALSPAEIVAPANAAERPDWAIA